MTHKPFQDFDFEAFKKRLESLPFLQSFPLKFVAIDGWGGAGKTTFSELLSQSLANCPILHTDDFACQQNPFDWYKDLLEKALIPLSQGRSATFSKMDWELSRPTTSVTIKPNKFILIDGVSSSRQEFRPYLTYSIFIDTQETTRLKRALARDGESTLPLWEEWIADEKEFERRQNLREIADLVIDNES